MKFRHGHRLLPLALAGAWLAFAGCKDIFVPKIKVLVDAISVPGGVKPNGKSYKLVARRSVVVNQQQVNVVVVSACVKAALNQVGLFEAPEKVAPDYFVEVTYGQDTASRIDPMSRESFLQLSARTNPDRNLDHGRGPEVWDVRTAIQGLSGRFENAMPMLATMAATYAGQDTHVEIPIDVPQNSPLVATVREAALRELDAKGMIEPAATAPRVK
jgi:hypothetical protein